MNRARRLMKSRNRPPLKLTNNEAVPPLEMPDTPASDVEIEVEVGPTPEIEAEPHAELEPLPVRPPERPMSKRRRRRLAEEARQAEERAAAALKPKPEPLPEAEPAPPPVESLDVVPSVAPEIDPEPTVESSAAVEVPSALWIGGVASWAAYEFGSGAADLDPLRFAIYALMALAPAGLAIMLAHAVRQGAGLAAETRRARDMAEALVAPTALAAQQTGQVLNSLRTDIDHAALAAERARNDMVLLRQALAEETDRLNAAAENDARTARRLTENLARERDQMQTLGVHLDSQATGVIDAVERQSRMVADASDLAQAQLREAEAALAARAADLAAAAGEAQDAARVAADDL